MAKSAASRVSRRARKLTSISEWRKFAHKGIFLFLAAIFGLSLVAYFGSGPLGGLSGRANRMAGNEEAIATVNGEPVARADYDRQWDRMKQFGGTGELQAASMKGMILSGAVDSALARSIAKHRGLTVSDADIDKALNEIKKSGPGGKPMTDDDLQKQLEAQGMSMNDLREQMKTSLLPKKLQESLASSQHLTEDDLLKSYDEAKLRHILIATVGGPRPTPGAMPDAQAKHRADLILAKVKAGGDFAKLADEYTMDPSNAPKKWDPKLKKEVPSGPAKGGDLGWYKRGGGFVKEFEDAAFSLKPGQTSDIVKSPFGYHIIKVEAVRRNLPKDYAQQKSKLLDQLKEQKTQPEFQKLMDDSRKTAKIVWNDPSLEWMYEYGKVSNPMGMMSGGGQGDQEAFVAKLRKYVVAHPDDAAANLVLSQNLFQKYMMAGLPKPGQKSTDTIQLASNPERDSLRKEIIKADENALKRTEDQSTRFSLAQLYREDKQNDKALDQYKTIKRLLSWDDSSTTLYAHQQLERAFKDLSHPELVAEETKKVAELQAKQKEEAAKRKAEEEKAKAASKSAGKPGDKNGITLAPGGSGTVTVTPNTGKTPAAETKPESKAEKPSASAPKSR